MTRVVCDFLHDESSARSRNRMRQSTAIVVPSKSALRLFGLEMYIFQFRFLPAAICGSFSCKLIERIS